jgi:hypothetical protein
VLGQPNFTQSASNSDAAGTQASGPSPFGMSIPWSLATNGTQLYVSDSGNNRILVWNSIPTVNQQPADAVIGQTSLYTSGRYVSPGSGSVLSYPIHINLLGSTLSIADYLNSRVLLVPQ